jgi:hypothetical protein
MIVMLHVGRFEAGRGTLEDMPMHHSLLFQDKDCPINRRERDSRIDRMGTPMQLVRIRMIV